MEPGLGPALGAVDGAFEVVEWGAGPAGASLATLRRFRRRGGRVVTVLGTGTGLRPGLEPGVVVLLDDQINLTGDSPLVGSTPEDVGPRFPDLSEAFDAELRAAACRAAEDRGLPLQRGVFAGTAGDPDAGTLEVLRASGADLVGGSIVGPVIAARHMGLPVLGIAIVTGAGFPTVEPRIAEVLRDVLAEVRRGDDPVGSSG
jgi:purine-nucleoside phosphorylase